jgi:hypothetical protein
MAGGGANSFGVYRMFSGLISSGLPRAHGEQGTLVYVGGLFGEVD